MRPSEILERAADVMLLRGKAACTYVDERGSVCAIAALAIADGCKATARDIDRWWSGDTWVYTSPIRNAFGTVVQWSDEHCEAEVIAGLRAVAATLRAQETQVTHATAYSNH